MFEVRSGLQRLDDLDRWRVVTYWRWLWWRQLLQRVPLLGKIGALNSIVLLACLFVAPSPAQASRFFVPLLWMGAYAFSLSVCMLLPRWRRLN